MSGGNGGIAIAKIKRIKTAEGSGRGRGSERGSRATALTRTTGTKQSTGIAEATTRTCSHLETASCSSAQTSSSRSPPTITVISESSSSETLLPLFILLVPSLQGCCCYLYDLTVTFMYKQDWAHSAIRLHQATLDFIKVFFIFYFNPVS